MIQPQNSRRRIVLADDSRFWREKISNILMSGGHEVLTAESGEPALELCLDPSRPVDLLVVDLVMPGMDGFQVAKRIKGWKLIEWLPIIAITGHFSIGDFPDGCLPYCFDEILEKSESPTRFLSVINKFLNSHGPSRRPVPRVPSEIPAQFRTQEGQEDKGTITNISTAGAYMAVPRPLAPGLEVSLAFSLPDGCPVRALALVVWGGNINAAEAGGLKSGIGLIFKALNPGAREAVEAYVTTQLERS